MRGFIREGEKEGRLGALEEVKDLAEAVAHRRSLTLWDVELHGRPGTTVVRVFVGGNDGVDLDTVAQVSEELSRALDLKDPIPGRYTLEVSSPGLERNLKNRQHFELSTGEAVVVKTTEILHGKSHRIDGTVVSARDDSFVMRTDDGQEIDVPYSSLRSARTVFEWR